MTLQESKDITFIQNELIDLFKDEQSYGLYLLYIYDIIKNDLEKKYKGKEVRAYFYADDVSTELNSEIQVIASYHISALTCHAYTDKGHSFRYFRKERTELV